MERRPAATSCCPPPSSPGKAVGAPPRPHRPPGWSRDKGAVMRMLARKLPFYLITFVIAITIDFFIPRLMPGNALDAILAKAGSQMGSPQALHALEKLYGIDNPASL